MMQVFYFSFRSFFTLNKVLYHFMKLFNRVNNIIFEPHASSYMK